MDMFSDPARDTRTTKHVSGGYEWWYFDAVSADGSYSFVIIFYEGNPFSLPYIQALDEETDPMPMDYPAISISIYEDGQPIYYSFTEFNKEDCFFEEGQCRVQVGPHRMEGTVTEHSLEYKLHIEEQLPSSDEIEATIRFTSDRPRLSFGGEKQSLSTDHEWNMVQPRAEVEGTIHIGNEARQQTISFQGSGYHDHNTGHQPMYKDFTDWYWGRFHFEAATLVYYAINRDDEQQQRAWLMDVRTQNIIETFDYMQFSDTGRSLFGLSVAHKLEFRSDTAEIQIQQSRKIDNGPFYQRFLSDGFLSMPSKQVLESQQGISEYIRPNRIRARIFWPLVNMRIRQAHQKPHWVQRSKKLYRWTW